MLELSNFNMNKLFDTGIRKKSEDNQVMTSFPESPKGETRAK